MSGKRTIYLIVALIILLAVLALLDVYSATTRPVPNRNLGSTPNSSNRSVPNKSSVQGQAVLSEPLSNALARVTKKPFGLLVSPGHSPVSPERFSGYHTGADFETTPAEQTADVPVFAVCAGPLILKRTVSGYGGVVVQSCQINNSAVTVLYGHLRLSSISANLNQNLSAGQQLGVLGTGYSAETDGERKHLHLSIHKGPNVNLLGYVQKPGDLAGWLDPVPLLKK
jgi:murein DD-endopeptidase MepM/ murein hydrolase activator NlpD